MEHNLDLTQSHMISSDAVHVVASATLPGFVFADLPDWLSLLNFLRSHAICLNFFASLSILQSNHVLLLFSPKFKSTYYCFSRSCLSFVLIIIIITTFIVILFRNIVFSSHHHICSWRIKIMTQLDVYLTGIGCIIYILKH